MSGGIGVSAPTDPVQAFLADIANLRQRIADLERAAQRNTGTPWSAWNSKVKFGGSLGNVTSVGQWQYDGDYINLEIGWQMSGGAGAVGSLTIDMPVAVLDTVGAPQAFPMIGLAQALDSGVARYPSGLVYANKDINTTTACIQRSVVETQSLWSNSLPWNWGNGDQGGADIRYRWR